MSDSNVLTIIILSVSALLVFFLCVKIGIALKRWASKPSASKPSASKPSASKPSASKPSASKPIKLCSDWAGEKDVLERFRQRLVFETDAPDLAAVRVWKQRNVNVQIKAPRYPGEYVIPHTVDLDKITLDALLDYRQSKIVEERPIPLGITELDSLLEGGAYAGEIYIIAGPAKSGRSTMAHLCAASVANRQERVIVAHGAYDRSHLTVAMRPFLKDDRTIERVRSVHYGISTPVSDVTRLLDRVITGARDIRVVIVDGLEIILSGAGAETRDDEESLTGQHEVVIQRLRDWAAVHGCVIWATKQSPREDAISMRVQQAVDGHLNISRDVDAKTLTLTPIKFRRVRVLKQPIAINLEHTQLAFNS